MLACGATAATRREHLSARTRSCLLRQRMKLSLQAREHLPAATKCQTEAISGGERVQGLSLAATEDRRGTVVYASVMCDARMFLSWQERTQGLRWTRRSGVVATAAMLPINGGSS